MKIPPNLIFFKYPILLLIISILGYWGTLYYAPIYDLADQFFPSRHFMFECIHHHIFPLWNPYQSLGLPIHADPQANTFYLPLWILSFFGEYSPMMWGVEFILHAFCGGLGFYFLFKRLISNKLISFLIAVCYMMSGFYVANMQHLSWIIAATWMPWIVHGFIRIFTEPSLKNACFLALSSSLMFTGAYPGFILLCILLFSVYLLFYFIKNIFKKNTPYLKKITLFLFITLIFSILLSSPALISLFEVKEYMTRGLALDYDKTSSVVFTPQSLISLLYPYISTSNAAFIQTDISMGNIYIGIFTLIFAVVGLWQKKTIELKIFLWWCFVCFLLSFGYYLPFHKWAFYIIPFINLIRIPAMFRLFTIMGLLILAVIGLEKILAKWQKHSKILYLVLSIVIVSDVVINAWLCREVGMRTDLINKELNVELNRFSDGFPPPREVITTDSIARQHHFHVLWRNLGIFTKQIESESYNGFCLRKHEEMNLPYYAIDKLLMLSSVISFPKTVLYSEKPILFNIDTSYTSNKETVFSSQTIHHKDTIIIEQFNPTKIIFQTHCEEARPLLLAQNYYPGWHAQIEDGKYLKINRLNTSLMSVNVPAGMHKITFFYSKPLLKIGFIVEIIAFVLILMIKRIANNMDH